MIEIIGDNSRLIYKFTDTYKRTDIHNCHLCNKSGKFSKNRIV